MEKSGSKQKKTRGALSIFPLNGNIFF